MKKILLVASILFVSGTAFATLLELYSLERLVLESQSVVLAEALHKKSEVRERKVYTFTTFRVEESFLGNLSVGETFVVRQRGGRIGKYEMITMGDARFEVGKRYVLFLRQSGKEWTLTAMAQAALYVFKENGKWWIENRDKTPRLNRKTGKIVQSAMLVRTPLDEFLSKLRLTINKVRHQKNGEQ